MNIIHLFHQIAKKHPQAIAIQDRNQQWTYQEVDHITHFLASQWSFPKGEIIGLRFEKSPAFLISLFSVMKKGNPFVVLNMQLPPDRIQYMVDTLNLQHIVDMQTFEQTMQTYQPSINVSFDMASPNGEELAYVVFTSGSTGNPKGVLVTHRGLVPLIEQQVAMFELKPERRFLLTNSISFDASLSDIFTVFTSGATLCLDPQSNHLIDSMRHFHITHLDISPSILNVLYQDIPYTHLQTVVVGGELLSEQAIRFMHDKIKLVNVYGPTETTICTSMKVMKVGVKPNCIGVPIEGVRYLLEDGELIIESDACADGYCNTSSDKFWIQHGKRYYRTGDFVEYEDGEFYFLGRKDRQVKIKGFRVELEEIEMLLKKETKQDNVAVVFKGNKLACFSLQEIQKKTLVDIPYYMIPDVFIPLERFELNSNGKIDYRYLESLLTQYKHHSLLEVFSEVFKQDVSLEDTWNTLCGDSLDLVSIMIGLEEAQLEISVEDLLSGKPLQTLIDGTNQTMELSTEYLRSTVQPLTFPSQKVEKRRKETVLVTGATGYLASHLLELLLREEENEEEYLCLVRAQNLVEGKQKLKDTFRKFGLKEQLLEKRNIHIQLGDLSLERLGLEEKDYESFKHRITKVIHSAALVNNLLPYQDMYGPNVKGTQEIIRLGKPIHYVSTLSVFVGTDKNTGRVYEEDNLETIQKAYGGYAQSKWVAEYLIRKSGLPFVCYRFGLLTGHTQKNYHNPKEFLSMLLTGIPQLGCLPSVDLNQLALDISPIDFAANVMKDLYLKSPYFQTYHIANQEGSTLELIRTSLISSGCAISLVEPSQFKEAIFSCPLDVNTKSIFLTLCRFDSALYEKYRHCDLFQRSGIEFDMTNTLNRLHSITFPPVNQELISHYIQNTRREHV